MKWCMHVQASLRHNLELAVLKCLHIHLPCPQDMRRVVDNTVVLAKASRCVLGVTLDSASLMP